MPCPYNQPSNNPTQRTLCHLSNTCNLKLRRCLPQAAELLAPQGRLAIITFHSLEDVVVKESLRPFGRRGGRTDWQLVRRGRVIRPDATEVRGNPRSRSAKLRVYEKVRVKKAMTG